MTTFTLVRRNGERTATSEKLQFLHKGILHEVFLREDDSHATRPWSYRRTTARAFMWSHVLDLPNDELEQIAKEEGVGLYDDTSPRLNKAWKAHNREEVSLMSDLLDAALEVLNLHITYRFSRTAGCKCGCSPGFILNTEFGCGLPEWVDVFISEVNPPKKEKKLEMSPSNMAQLVG